jgi:hypothetical protein
MGNVGCARNPDPTRKTQAPMQADYSVVAGGPLEPGQAADEHELQQHRRQPGQPAERDGPSVGRATQEQPTRDVPPRDADDQRVQQPGCSEPLRWRDAVQV